MSAEVAFPLPLVMRKVAPGAVLAEPLFFHEFARLGANRAAAGTSARRNLLDFVPKLDPAEILRRRRAAEGRPLTFTLEVEPPRANEAWRDPLTLTFHAVVWEQNPAEEPNGPLAPLPSKEGRYVLARVAELGIEVIAEPGENLVYLLRREALAALRRANLTTGLRPLAFVQTTLGFAVENDPLAVTIPSLKDRAIRAETEAEEGKKTLLQQVGTLLGRDHDKTYEADDTVRDLGDALTANPPQSVLLIGPSGVGKTAVVRELARRWHAADRAPVYQTSGSRIVAGQCGFGMWQQRCQELVKDAVKRKAVVHAGPLVELLEVGKSEHNSSGIATFLRPAIARGELLCVAECTPEQLPLIEKQDPQLLDAFRHLTIEEPSDAKGRAILASFARDNARRSEASESSPRAASGTTGRRETQPAALAATDRLHRRYATYSAYPGRPLRFLENLLRDGPADLPITEGEVYDAFTRETGLPRAIIDPALPLDLAATHEWFSKRVVGQPEAVSLVTDLLATVKAGLTRANRPIASLLFIGPTGVGKTEMAKAVAEFLFGSKDRLTRFDMSEYADPVAVRRLVGGAFGSEGLLTAKVREQPFSVLLLDEVEKADGSFFDLLLQALGEARLTDAGGRLADFRNTVVILTSNLGAESYRRGTAGFVRDHQTEKASSQDHFAKAVEAFLRPEMFNRLDRIVPFSPLGTEIIRQIADREWQKVLHRDGVRFRDLDIAADPALLDHLAAVGFDPRYGARPLKRAMERELLAPLARQMNRHAGDTPLAVEVGVAGGAPSVAVRPLQAPRARAARDEGSSLGELALAAQGLRRWHQLLGSSSVVRELHNDAYQLSSREKKVLKKQALGKKLSPEEVEVLAELGRLRELAGAVARHRSEASALEDAAVIAFHESDVADPPPELRERLAAAKKEWDALLLQLYARTATQGDRLTVAVFGEHRPHVAAVAFAYRAAALAHGLSVEVMRYDLPAESDASAAPPPPPVVPPGAKPPRTAWLGDRLFTLQPPKVLLKRTAVPPVREGEYTTEKTVGVALSIAGTGAVVRFRTETGLHVIKTPESLDGDNPNVMVRTSGEPLPTYRPPEACVRRGWYRDERPRREYDLTKGEMHDGDLERVWSNLYGGLIDWIGEAVAANTRAQLLKLVTE
jgi:ATP-dependent Clp protease ATP-binding subunit ClpA